MSQKTQRENWIERQARMVKCKRHGLHFDPKKASGCYLCLKERGQRRVGPKFLIILVSVLGMVVVVFRIFGPDLRPQEEALVGLEISEEEALAKISPEGYRQEMQAFERALFELNTRTSSDLDTAAAQISSTAIILRDTLNDRDPESVAARAFDELADVARGGLDYGSLERLRDDWLRFRGRHLESADWLHTPKGQIQQASHTQRAAAAEYRDIAYELVNLLQDGSAEASAMAGSDDTEGWTYFMEGWKERLDSIVERKPKRPKTSAHPKVLQGFESLERALRQAYSLASGRTSPRDLGRFNDALATAEAALQAFDEAG